MAIANLVASSRAWVGPYDVLINGFLLQSNATDILIKYKNTGKQPALNFNDSYNDDWTGTMERELAAGEQPDLVKNCWADGPTGAVTQETCHARIKRWVRDYCWSKAPYENRVVYPDFPYETSKPFQITPERVGVRRIAFLQGCFIYRGRVTAVQDHRSAFCFLDQLLPNGRSRQMRSCSVGNDAN